MLFALRHPSTLLGLVLAFLLGVLVRAVVIRLSQRRRAGFGGAPGGPVVSLRRDLDIFGVVSAAIGGTGWGRKVEDVGAGPPPVSALLAGPVAVLACSQVAFAAYRLAGGSRYQAELIQASSVLHADLVPPGTIPQILLGLAVGLLCFGVLALIPLPPLDGWGLLRHAVRRPGTGFQKARYWLEDQNVGVAILLAGMLLPLVGGLPLFLFLIDLVTWPVLLLWS